MKVYKDGKESGNVLDLVAWKVKTIKLEVMKFVLQLENIEIRELQLGESIAYGNIPFVLEEAVMSDREDLVFLLLSMEKTFPQFNHWITALSCLVWKKTKLFAKLLPKISQDWTPPGMKRYPVFGIQLLELSNSFSISG